MTGEFIKSASVLALLAAAGIVVGGIVATPKAARAADLGGDCCADLEERIAELEATTARKSNKKISLTITGRVNANILYWNDNSGSSDPHDTTKKTGPGSDVYIGNAVRDQESRIIFKGDGKISSDVTAGFQMEIRDDFSVKNPFDGSGVDSQSDHQHGPTLSARSLYVFIKSKSAGEVRLGNMDAAARPGWVQDLGGGSIGGFHNDVGMSSNFLLRTANNALSGSKWGSKLYGDPVDQKDDRILYISPTLGGFEFRADAGGGDNYSGSLTYTGKFQTVSLALGGGLQSLTETDSSKYGSNLFSDLCYICAGGTETLWGVSGSVSESGSGLFLTGEYGGVDSNVAGTNQWRDWFVRGGWKKNVNGLGDTTVDANYYSSDSGLTHDTVRFGEAHYIGVGIEQAIDAVSSSVYLRYQHNTYSGDKAATGSLATAIDSQNLDLIVGGMIVKF